MTHRFFVDEERLAPDQCRQIREVLRLAPGSIVTLVHDGEDLEYRLDWVTSAAIDGTILSRRPVANEPRVSLTLALSLLRGDHAEEVVEAVSQIGVTTIVPYASERSVVRELSPAKRQRWERIAREAAETSRRGRIPVIEPVRTWRALFDSVPVPIVVAWEEETSVSLEEALPSGDAFTLVIGPEGGITEAEIAFARERGARTVTLGRLNLRAETAAIVAVARSLAGF